MASCFVRRIAITIKTRWSNVEFGQRYGLMPWRRVAQGVARSFAKGYRGGGGGVVGGDRGGGAVDAI